MSKGALCVIPVSLPQFTVKQSKTDFHAGCLRIYFCAKNNLSKAEMGRKKMKLFFLFFNAHHVLGHMEAAAQTGCGRDFHFNSVTHDSDRMTG